MRQLTNTVTIVTLLMVAAAFALGSDAAAADGHHHSAKLSVNRQQSHSAKRVMAKLSNAAAAKSILQARATRFGQPDLEAVHSAEHRVRREKAVARHRAMSEQQVKNKTTVGINDGVTQFWDAPHCGPSSKFRVLETRFHDICARVDFSFVRRHWNDAGRANQAYERFCTSECAGSINDLLQFTDGYTCFDSDTLSELRLFSAMCQLSTSAPPQGASSLRCGAEVAVSGVFDTPDVLCHEFVRKETCQEDRDNCQWDDLNEVCNERITRQKIEAECSTCYQGIVDVLSDELNPLCAKYQGEFCLPKMFEMQRVLETAGGSPPYPASAISQICDDAAMLPCFQQQSVGIDNMLLRDARTAYRQCIEDGSLTQVECQTAFEREHQGVQESQRLFDTICTRASPSGPWCNAVTLNTTRNNGCPALDSARADETVATCTANCASANAEFLSEAGCCAAFVAQGAPATADSDFPVFDNAPAVDSGSLLAGRGASFQSWNVAKIEQCAADGAKLYDWANDATCPDPSALSAKWTVSTVLALTAIDADASRKDTVLFAIKLDLGKAAGVPANRLVISLDAVTLPNGEPGTNVSVQIRGPAAAADRALAQLRAAFVTGHLRMENVDRAIRTCKDCKPVTAASAVPQVFDKIPGAPLDYCNTEDFIEPFQALITACSATDVDSLFSLVTADITAADSAWTTACNSQCLEKFREVRSGDYSVCLPRDILALGDLMSVGCQKDTSDRRCGAVLTIMTGNDCSALDETQCQSAGQCRWNNRTGCRDQFGEAFLQDVCNGGCITKLAATVGFNNDGFAKEAKLLDTMFCSKDGDTMCLPHIQGTINELEEKGLTAPVVTNVCEERSKLRCMKRIFAAVAADEIFNAEQEFYHCVETVLDDDRVSHDAKQSTIETLCIENGIAATISAADQIEDQLNHMCIQNSRGDYCLALVDRLVSNSSCLENMLHNNYCPSDCVSEVESAIEQLGCCTGNVQEVNGFIPFANLDEQDVPEFEVFEDYGSDFGGPAGPSSPTTNNNGNNNVQQTTGGSGPGNRVGHVSRPGTFQVGSDEDEITQPKWYYLANFQTCNSDRFTTGDLVYKKCKKPRGAKKESRELDLGISWETLSASPKKQRRVEKKLRQDLSVKIGLSSDDFPSFGMKQNTEKKVQVQGKQPGAPSRRQTTDNSASTSSFDMNTDSDSDTEASAASYDQHVADGTLTLSSTLATVANECDNCTSTDVSSANTVATSVTVDSTVSTPSPSTGAATASGLAALLAAALLALLH